MPNFAKQLYKKNLEFLFGSNLYLFQFFFGTFENIHHFEFEYNLVFLCLLYFFMSFSILNNMFKYVF